MLVPHAGIYLVLISFTFLMHLATCQEIINTLPPDLENVTITGLLVVSVSPCSKTCGLGWRSEYYCRLNKKAHISNCTLTNALCLINQDCGLIAKTTTVGATLSISCLDATIKTLGSSDFIFVWKIARGIVTTDLYLFKVFPLRDTKTPWMIIVKLKAYSTFCILLRMYLEDDYIRKFFVPNVLAQWYHVTKVVIVFVLYQEFEYSEEMIYNVAVPRFMKEAQGLENTVKGALNAKEKHAGTYMCQVQNSKTMQIVKRVLIGVRIIPENLVQLNYYEVLSPEQKEEMEILQGNPVAKKLGKSFWEKVKDLFKSTNMAIRVFAIGLAIGGSLAFVFGAIFLCMTNK
ncbi:transmembrane protein 81-like [Carcharodon carcharias]|uniref:transmembrane protein 81-like n=1 Tax=Carcharodon carcharias TaxID=13397 RepID=UPI001B7E19B6|nr:transmembrane protein 81-like [Carcharodon carcharias]